MMNRPRLSVIIPTYNRSHYVEHCLRVLQRCGIPRQELEIIVADDGSTDDTAAVVARTDPQAVYLWQENTGTPSTARNLGFARSRGRYVAFLDCDDEWLPDVPGQALDLLDRHPEVDILFADAWMGNRADGFRSWIEIAGQNAFCSLPHQELESEFRKLERQPFLRRMAERNPVFIGATILRREVFAGCGGFDPSLRGAADWELWLRLSLSVTFGYLNRPLAIYTRHETNMSDNHDHMIHEFCETLQKLLRNPRLKPDDRDWIEQLWRRQLFYHAYNAFDAGEYGRARPRFRKAIRAGNRQALPLYLACHFPTGVIRGIRRLKQTLASPSLKCSGDRS